MKKIVKKLLAVCIVLLATANINSVNAQEEIDIIAPAGITNLAVSSVMSNSAILIWTATGDDAKIGTAASFDLRYSSSSINATNWPSSIQIENEPVPEVAGTNHTITITGLNSGTTYYFAIKSSDEVANVSAISNVASAKTLGVDSIVPAAITNLDTSTTTLNSIILTWTATGDDAKIGTAFSYDLRYSTSTINASNWPVAIQAANEPKPQIAETNQTMTITGLSSGTTYYFAIKVLDEVANISAISNVVSAKTLGIDSIAPASITNLTVSAVALNSVILTWIATGDDAKIGTASRYDLRYSTSSINTTNWSSATQTYSEPTPQIAGTNQEMTIYNLESGTTYYFAIKVSDEEDNVSAISNVTSAKTITPEDTTPPGKVKEFVVKNKALKNNSAFLIWVNPIDKDFSKVLIIRKEGAYSTNINDGVKIYEGVGIQFDDANVVEGRIYYYSAYSYDKSGVYSAPEQCIFFVNNTLIKKAGDYKIYAVINSEKRWIPTSAVFNRKNYEWKNVYIISERDFNSLTTGAAIESDEKAKLIKGKTNPKVYLIKGDKRFWIPTAEAFNKSGYIWKDIVKVEDGEVMGYADIKLGKEENNDTTYYFYASIGMKKAISSAQIFLSYPLNRWEDVEVLTQAELDSYENVNLIRKSGDYKVYYLENGAKRFISTQEIFNSHKFSWAKVAEINETEFNSYPAALDLK